MKLLSFLSDCDFNPKFQASDRTGYQVRRAGRAVLTNRKNEIALLWIGKFSVYKLPGGGIEDNEDIHEGLKREILEETGCHASIGDEIGLTLEFRDEWKLVQISYCYKAVVTDDTKNLNLTDEEKSDKFALKWVSQSEAIALMEKHTSSEYDPKFMRRRDIAILRAGQ
jgi:8-oxo-dGTP diphosphatase